MLDESWFGARYQCTSIRARLPCCRLTSILLVLDRRGMVEPWRYLWHGPADTYCTLYVYCTLCGWTWSVHVYSISHSTVMIGHYYSTRNNAACTHCQKITCDLVLGVWGLQRSQTNYCDKIVKIIHASLHVGIQMTDFFRIAMNLNFIAWENSAFCHHPQIGQSSWFLASKPRCLKQKSYRRFDPSGTFSISSTIGTMDWHHNFKQKFYWANNKKILSGISKHYLQALEDISMHACINF